MYEYPIQLDLYTEGIGFIEHTFCCEHSIKIDKNTWKSGTVQLDYEKYEVLESFVYENYLDLDFINKVTKRFYSISRSVKDIIARPLDFNFDYSEISKIMGYTVFNWIFNEIDFKKELQDLDVNGLDIFRIASRSTILPHYIYKEYRILDICGKNLNKTLSHQDIIEFQMNVLPLIDFNVTPAFVTQEEINEFFDKYIEQNVLDISKINRLKMNIEQQILTKRQDKFKIFNYISKSCTSEVRSLYLLLELINTEEEMRHYLQMYFQKKIYDLSIKENISLSDFRFINGRIVI
ncbi:TPA: hypothetical protein U2C70_001693 [Streptococcus suis]|nr:hypothetical protein [Streptococcus suis]